MENYIVSARKYRPATFDSVVGQKALTTTLKNAIATNKLAHAYLFCGPRGVGKTTCARIFAKTINCLHPTPEGEACNACESCVAFNEQRSYNIHELDAASNNSVDDIRQLVEQVRIAPQIGQYKVYIIDEVHMLTTSAFNAFLKTLEEPPRHAVFVLATTEKHKILPTILSRCQIYDFNRISVEDTVEHLMYVAQKEGVKTEAEALNVIALKADGGMRDALSIFDQVVSFTGGNITYQGVIENLNVLDYDYYFKLTDHLLSGDVRHAMLLFDDVLSHGFEGSHFITGFTAHLRDLLVSKDEVTLPLLEVGAGIREKYRVQAQKCPVKFLYRAMKLCNECDLNYRVSKNKRLLVEVALIEVAQLVTDADDPAHGRVPQKTLKPIVTSQPAAQQQAASPTPAATTPMPVPPAVQKPATVQQPPAMTAEAPVHSRPEMLESAAAPAQKEVPTRRKERISIKAIAEQGNPATANKAENPTDAQGTNEAAMDEPVDEQQLNYQWLCFANLLPVNYKALAERMKAMRLTLTDPTTFEAPMENSMLIEQFMPIKPNIESFLRRNLKNSKLSMTFRVIEVEQVKRAITRPEKYKAMLEENPALEELRKEFGLEFD